MKRLIREGTTQGVRYFIYEDADGSVYVDTVCNRHYVIAETYEKYVQIPEEKLTQIIYGAEMSKAR